LDSDALDACEKQPLKSVHTGVEVDGDIPAGDKKSTATFLGHVKNKID